MANLCYLDALVAEVGSSNFSLWDISNLNEIQQNFSTAEILTAAQTAFFATLKSQYLNNDYFAGGLGLMIIGLFGKVYAQNVRFLWSLFQRRRGVFSLTIKPEDGAYQWLQEWLCKHANKYSTQLTLMCKWENEDDNDDQSFGGSFNSDAAKPKLFFLPQLVEAQRITYKGQLITCQIKREVGPANRGESNGEDLATLLQSASLARQLVLEGPTREILEDIVREAMEDALKVDETKRRTLFLRWDVKNFYWHGDSKLVRPLDSIVLDCDVNFLLEDAKGFLSNQKWYSDRGIPHRRGYIFYGPPGCGKTSLIQALAGELRLDLSMISLANKGMDDDMLIGAMSRASRNSILVLEDVDAIFSERNEGEDKKSSLSFSGLLNAIDGMSAQEGHILIMTTNHLEKLDSALIRPGRVDLRIHLGLASRDQIARVFLRFFPETNGEIVEKFAALLPEKVLSPAMIQGHLLMHRNDPQAAIDKVGDLMAQLKSEQERVSGSSTPSEGT